VQRGQDDGLLTALEAQRLDLEGTELVILSACETALGRPVKGEGMLGLQRAFQVAGARSLISSLWQVDDHATSTLMGEFYKNLWERKLGKLESLHQAQLTILRQYDPKLRKLRGPGKVRPIDSIQLTDATSTQLTRTEPLPPCFWAAFVLSGDWR
jgi:CHAT domain-containing protein